MVLVSFALMSPRAMTSATWLSLGCGGAEATGTAHSPPPRTRTRARWPGERYAFRRGTRSRETSASRVTRRTEPGTSSSTLTSLAAFQSGWSSAANLATY